MAAVTQSARSQWSYGKIEDCEQSIISLSQLSLPVSFLRITVEPPVSNYPKCLWRVVAYERWLHMEVRLVYIKKLSVNHYIPLMLVGLWGDYSYNQLAPHAFLAIYTLLSRIQNIHGMTIRDYFFISFDERTELLHIQNSTWKIPYQLWPITNASLRSLYLASTWM